MTQTACLPLAALLALGAAAGAGGDITKANPAVDMPEILRHAKAKGVGIWLWAHWTAVDQQMDEAFALYEEWGVAGVKIDFMDRDDQWMVDYYHRVAENPFTRMLAGPMDYTPGGFRNVTPTEFEPRGELPLVLGTRAHRLALFVVFESPLQMVSDYPGAYAGQKDFDFVRAVPASWDETRVLSGRPGEHITVARRRGDQWFLGSLTDGTPRELEVPLGFLGDGGYVAEIYADAPDAGTHPTKTVVEEKRVSARSALTLKLATGGGAAVRLRPAD